jgi:acyl-CoA synthetase (AMP-forming)/AMP-acid ligase II
MQLMTLADEEPSRVAAVDGSTGAETTYSMLDRESVQLARHWASVGLRPGDVVAVLMSSTPRFLTVVWGAWRSGFYIVPVNWHLTAGDAGYILSNSGARALVASSDLADLAGEVVAIHGRAVISRLLVGGTRDGFDDFDATIARQPVERPAAERNGSLLLYSSGTTGRPKGIRPPLPTTAFGAPINLEGIVGPVGVTGARAGIVGPVAAAGAPVDRSSVYLSPAPLYHGAPLGWSLAMQAVGVSVVVMDRFDPEQVLALVERHHVTHVQFVPTMFVRMLKLPAEVRQRYDLSSLRYVVHAAAPCRITVKEQMIDWLGPIVHEYYSASESNCLFMIDAPTWLAHRGSVGKAAVGVPHILDDEGKELPAGEIGQLWIEGPSHFEYHGDPEKTAGAFNDRGWSTVGDIGSIDEDGFLYLSDRRTDLILVGGANVYPRETEDVLATHPCVAEAAVIGVPDDDMGSQVRAVVELNPGSEPTDVLAAELMAYCRERLATIKCPRAIHFEETLPRLATGKLLRRELRDRYAEPQRP